MNKDKLKETENLKVKKPRSGNGGGIDHTWTIIGLSVAVIVLVVGAFAFGMYWSVSNTIQNTGVPTTVTVDEPKEDVDDDQDNQEELIEIEKINTSETLNITWLDPENRKDIFLGEPVYDVFFPGYELYTEEYGIGIDAFEIGSINGGVYDDYSFQLWQVTGEGLGVFTNNFYVLKSSTSTDTVVMNKYVWSMRGSFSVNQPGVLEGSMLGKSEMSGLAQLGFKLETGATISEYELESSAKDDQGHTFDLMGVSENPNNYRIYRSDVPDAVLSDGTKLFLEGDEDSVNRHAFYTLREDGELIWYDYRLSIWPERIEGEGYDRYTAIPNVTWLNKFENEDKFSKGRAGGCGMISILNQVEPSEIAPTVQMGTYANTDGARTQLFGPDLSRYDSKEELPERLADLYSSWSAFMGRDIPEDERFAVFQESVPLFYFTDDFGRTIQLNNAQFIPLAECGKPVIYLYPEETTDISVEVAPRGGFTVTEPAYNDGWNVTAHPDGQLVNKTDGEVYPYLFWEGHGGLYIAPENYWVVEQGEVETFLDETLAELGFIDQEIADFKEFWLPRMESAPYYKIGFHGTHYMDMIAPMTLSEEPDTYFRVLMDYYELDEREEGNPPRLPSAPERTGFVVTEWGGVLK